MTKMNQRKLVYEKADKKKQMRKGIFLFTYPLIILCIHQQWEQQVG